jgi:hypothetical protein
MRNIETFLQDTQHCQRKDCYTKTLSFSLDGIESENDLMNTSFGQYGEMNNAWTLMMPGFIKILGNAQNIFSSVIMKHTVINSFFRADIFCISEIVSCFTLQSFPLKRISPQSGLEKIVFLEK